MESLRAEGGGRVNAAVFADYSDAAFIRGAVEAALAGRPALVVAAREGMGAMLAADDLIDPHDLALEEAAEAGAALAETLRARMDEVGAGAGLVIDMSWIVETVHGAGSIDAWATVAEVLAEGGAPVLSFYDRELMIEEQVRTAFRVHRQFAAPSGVHENPYWLPPAMAHATPDEQMSFILGRVVPDYAGQRFFERSDPFAVRGADPDWLARPRHLPASGASPGRWSIYCLGQLRVYRGGTERIDWKLPGSAPKKTRTLFAYLLTAGEKGAHADRIAELLWPDEAEEKTKRARLHHAVAMLRKTLGAHEVVVRTGDYYRLVPPPGSWIDITSFEQLCRRGVTLFKRGQDEEALQLYRTAEKLYGGNLFDDLPLEYVENELEDWCLARRTWLRDVAIKLHRDTSALLRRRGNLRQALEQCQKALTLDPTSEDANVEMMRVLQEQGRLDAVARQYRQYRAAMDSIGASVEGTEIQALFRAMTVR